MTAFNSGVISLNQNSSAVIGNGTSFTVDFMQGSALLINGNTYLVDSVVDDTHLTLTLPWPGPTATSISYQVYQTANLTAKTNALMTDLITSFGPLKGSADEFNSIVSAAVASSASNAADASAFASSAAGFASTAEAAANAVSGSVAGEVTARNDAISSAVSAEASARSSADSALATQALPTAVLLGAVGDGIANDTTAFYAACVANSKVLLGGKKYKVSGQKILPSGVNLIGPGEIIFTNDSDFLRFGGSNYVENVTFTGTLSTTTQFQVAYTGVTTYFATPTYQDYNAASISGTDFTHTLSGDVLTVGLPTALTTALGRMAVSSMLPLDTTAKYAIYVNDAFVSGDGAAPMQCWLTDSSGNETAQFTLGAGTPTLFIPSGTAGIKFKLGMARHNHTKTNLTCSFDLSKITVYKLINEMGAIPAGSALENGTNLDCYSTDTTLRGCTIRMMKYAAFKAVNSSRVKVLGCTVHSCLGGMSSQGSTKDEFAYNEIDLTLVDSNGNRVPSGIAVRNHCINLTTVVGTKVVHNTMSGASWAYENAEGSSLSNHVVVAFNEISAVNCGISASSDYGLVAHNNIRCSSLMTYGIELPTCSYTNCTFNSVWQDSPAIGSYGIAASNVNMRLNISFNTLRANTGVNVAVPTTNNEGFLTVCNNVISYWTNGIYSGRGGSNIHHNIIACLGRFSATGLSPTAGISIQCVFFSSSAVDNIVDGAGAYCVWVQTPQVTSVLRNVLNSFTASYDVWITASADYTCLPKFVGNVFKNPALPFAYDAATTPKAGSYFTVDENKADNRSILYLIPNTVQGLSPQFLYTPRGYTENTQTASYTATSEDQFRTTRMNVASANTFTIPPFASIHFPTGAQLVVQQIGAGATTIAAGTGVTIQKLSSASLTLAGQFSVMTLVQVTQDVWAIK